METSGGIFLNDSLLQICGRHTWHSLERMTVLFFHLFFSAFLHMFLLVFRFSRSLFQSQLISILHWLSRFSLGSVDAKYIFGHDFKSLQAPHGKKKNRWEISCPKSDDLFQLMLPGLSAEGIVKTRCLCLWDYQIYICGRTCERRKL